MKILLPILATFLYLLSSLNASGQKIHITDTSNHWIAKKFVDGGLDPDYYAYYYFDYTDTVIANGHTYNLLQAGYSNFLIREEGNKVFLKALRSLYSIGTFFTDTVNEFLYFDYDLQVGDTLTLPIEDYTPYPVPFTKHVVHSIDSILINNTWHKKFSMKPQLGSAFYDYIFIEGIGTSWGPIISSQYVTSTGLPYMVCFKNNGIAPLANLNDCDHPTSIKDPYSLNKHYFHCYPNPANEEITIEYSGQKVSEYYIALLDLSGRILLKTTFQSKTTLNISNFLSGMYIIQVADENGVLMRDKIIVCK